ncbi:ArsR/SmtB family transcription factor [Cellulomonas bogoriensis]|uniref:ArsR/SmtB family transcription factor n=1 Tax=Cellulomonas bogoriensis TaxID=301388 RepID=UPI000555FCCE|nr:metalloregulator ArsR/SmtB family transcription factor [Cellulomonas bogoriensis]
MTDVCTPAPRPSLTVDAAERAARVLKAVADPVRLRMLATVASSPTGEVCVCDLTDLADLTQPTVSHHLKVLRTAGVLTCERRGTWVHYRVTEHARPFVDGVLDGVVPAALTLMTATPEPEPARS